MKKLSKAMRARKRVMRFCGSKAKHKARHKRAMARWEKRVERKLNEYGFKHLYN